MKAANVPEGQLYTVRIFKMVKCRNESSPAACENGRKLYLKITFLNSYLVKTPNPKRMDYVKLKRL